jgi:flagellar biosynthesis protein FlhB
VNPDAATPAVLLSDTLSISLPVIAVAAGVALLFSVVQTGGLFAPALARGFGNEDGRILDRRRATSAALSGATTVVLLTAGPAFLLHEGASLQNVLGEGTLGAAGAGAFVARYAAWALAVTVVAAALDFWLVRVDWLGRLRMTRAEVRDERRQSEGDPRIRAAERRAHESLAAIDDGGAGSAPILPR